MNDKDHLRLFMRRVKELQTMRLVQEGYEVGITLNWSEDAGVLHSQLHQPDEELFRSLLLSLRNFLLAKEPTYIYRTYERIIFS